MHLSIDIDIVIANENENGNMVKKSRNGYILHNNSRSIPTSRSIVAGKESIPTPRSDILNIRNDLVTLLLLCFLNNRINIVLMKSIRKIRTPDMARIVYLIFPLLIHNVTKQTYPVEVVELDDELNDDDVFCE